MFNVCLDYEATSRRIKELRIQHGYSVEALRAMMDLQSVQAIYKWERSESTPNDDNLVILSEIYGVSIDSILIRKTLREESERSLPCFSGGKLWLQRAG